MQDDGEASEGGADLDPTPNTISISLLHAVTVNGTANSSESDSIASTIDKFYVKLFGSPAESVPFAFTVSLETPAQKLQREMQLQYFSTYDNWTGANEAWFLDRQGRWHILLPNGDLLRWSGAGHEGVVIASLGSEIGTAPRLLASPPKTADHASLSDSIK